MQTLNRVEFTKGMKAGYTVLVPDMLPIHFALIRQVLRGHGYRVELMDAKDETVLRAGLRYVHNDTCYPALCVIGQFISALQSGRYDVNHTALMITQTGGGCRASNYIHLLRKALRQAGFAQVPVISLNLSGLEKNSGFSLTLPLIRQMLACLVYGDMLMLLRNQTEPYEVEPGAVNRAMESWVQRLSDIVGRGDGLSLGGMRRNLAEIAREFDAIPTEARAKTKVGIVGEIYVKYSPLGNNGLEDFLRSENCEVCVPGVLDFMLFKVDNRLEDIRLYGGSRAKYMVVDALYRYITKMQQTFGDVLSRYPRFAAPSGYKHLRGLIAGVVGYGNKMGEGWLLTAEMLELAEQGFRNIVCTQPFGCLPNHIVGKGMIRKVRERFPEANIVPIDYDPGASKANQENRIKLMLSLAARQDADETTAASSLDEFTMTNG